MSDVSRNISITQPRRLAFGAGVAEQCASDLSALGVRKAFVVASPSTRPLAEKLSLPGASIWDQVKGEPTIDTFRNALSAAHDERADAVIGVGGGSPMDVAKLVAALLGIQQDIRDCFGIGKLVG